MAEFKRANRALKFELDSATETTTPNHPRLSAAPSNSYCPAEPPGEGCEDAVAIVAVGGRYAGRKAASAMGLWGVAGEGAAAIGCTYLAA
jgi:hypothetical protein